MRRRVMPSITPMSWEQKSKNEIEEFVGRCDWGTALRQWQVRVEQFGIVLNPLFLTVTVHDPGSPEGREPALSWWPTQSVSELHQDCQRHFDQYPGTRGPVHPFMNTSKGEIDTLRFMWACRDDVDRLAGVLIAASLFGRVEGRSVYLDEKWPRIHCLKVLSDWAYQAWQQNEGQRRQYGWHHACTWVLPNQADDSVYKIDNLAALVRYLAEEHAALLSTHRPVVIEYRPSSAAQLRSA